VLPKRPLTDRGITALKPAKGAYHLAWDALVPGLAVRVTATGAKSFVLVTRFPGSANPTARALGKVGAITLGDARTKGREWLAQIAAGTDPTATQPDEAAGTVRAICEDYLRREGAKLRSADWVRALLTRLVYPVLGNRPVAELRRSEIVALLDRVEDERGPAMANRTLSVIGRVMNWHATRSDYFRSPIVRGMARDGEVARNRVLTDDELRAVWSAAPGLRGREAEPIFPAYVRFLLLTGARRNEVSEMRWSELVGSDWVLPASRNKTGQDLLRPLSRAALEIIEGLPKLGEWVFTRTGNAPLSGLAQFKVALDRASGTSGWTYHDLRRTSRSLMSRAGVPSDHAERCLGHVIGGVRGVYDRHSFRAEMAEAYEKLSALIGEIVR
jgi:integrase